MGYAKMTDLHQSDNKLVKMTIRAVGVLMFRLYQWLPIPGLYTNIFDQL